MKNLQLQNGPQRNKRQVQFWETESKGTRYQQSKAIVNKPIEFNIEQLNAEQLYIMLQMEWKQISTKHWSSEPIVLTWANETKFDKIEGYSPPLFWQWTLVEESK